MNCLMTVRFSDCLGDQSSKLPFRHIPLMEHHATDNDPVNGIHLRKAAVDLLFEEAVCQHIFRPAGIRDIRPDRFQCFDSNGIATALVRTIAAVAHADMPCRSIAFSGPLELFPLLPIEKNNIFSTNVKFKTFAR